MDIYFTASWLLYSIYHSENDEEGADLYKIIANADYSNHAIISYDEFILGLTLLRRLDLVSERDNYLFTTMTYKDWWTFKFENKKRIYIQNEMSAIEKYIKNKAENEENIEDLIINTNISASDFDRAVKTYIDAFNNNKRQP